MYSWSSKCLKKESSSPDIFLQVLVVWTSASGVDGGAGGGSGTVVVREGAAGRGVGCGGIFVAGWLALDWSLELLGVIFFLLSKNEFLSKNKAIAMSIRAMAVVAYGRLLEIVRFVFFMGCWRVADSWLFGRVGSWGEVRMRYISRFAGEVK